MIDKDDSINNSYQPPRFVDRNVKILGHEIKMVTIIKGFMVFVVFFLVLAMIQFATPSLPGNDGYYHIKMAYLMRTEGLKPDFKWLPLTILNPREFYNHHFLFHVFLIPFTFGDLIIGAKWAAVLFASLAFLTVWRLFTEQKVPYGSIWALGILAVSEAFIYRMSLPRAQSLSLGVLAIALHWMLKGKHRRLILLGFFYVWLYNAFPLLLIVAVAYTAGLWLMEHRLDFRPFLYSSLGIIAGLVINPYFPYNLAFIFQHIFPKLVDSTAISVGSEWYPYTTQQLLSNSPLSLVLFLSGIIALGISNRRMKLNTAASVMIAMFFGLLLFQSRRFIEYFPPFVLIFSAFAWSPHISEYLRKSKPRDKDIQRKWVDKYSHLAPLIIMVMILVFMGFLSVRDARQNVQGSKPYTLYAGASEWLLNNTTEGERVFQTDWDDFTRIFFYNTHNTYLVGLDPTYMQFYNKDLYSVWVEITRGNIAQPSEIIQTQFGSNYVISDLLHKDFISEAELDPNMVSVYRDDEAVIYQLISEQ